MIVYLVTRSWQVNLLLSHAARWGLPVVTGMLVWLLMRYCRAHGYRFVTRELSTQLADAS